MAEDMIEKITLLNKIAMHVLQHRELGMKVTQKLILRLAELGGSVVWLVFVFVAFAWAWVRPLAQVAIWTGALISSVRRLT